ncbi:unnamed protein product [Diamesa hyperborea]
MDKSTCRVCLKCSSEVYASIFDNYQTVKICSMLEYVTGITIRIDSRWSNKICDVCWSDAVTAFDLKNRFIQSDDKLKKLQQERDNKFKKLPQKNDPFQKFLQESNNKFKKLPQESDNKFQKLPQESDPFQDLVVVKVEPELLIDDLSETVKSEIIELDFENIIYEEEPVMESIICLEEIDKQVTESDPMSSQMKEEKTGVIGCVKCVEEFHHENPKTTFEMFRKHMIVHNRQKHMCLLCDPPLQFAQELHLDHHNYILHDTGVNPLICKTCGFISDIEDKNYWHNYRKHIKTHKKTFTCDLCVPPTEHISEDVLQQHGLNEHFINETMLCHVCHKSFDDEIVFKRHRQKCVLKIKKTPAEKRVKLVKKLRSTAKHTCTLCTRIKYFESEVNLKNHMFIKHQIGVNPHTCKVCGMTFDFAIQLRRHNDETGTCKPTELPAKKTYKCYICNEEFAMAVSKIQHINTYHSDKANSDCHLCLRHRIPSACAYEQHLSTHYLDFAFICSYCGKGYHLISRLNNHIKHMHQTKYLTCDLCGGKNKSKPALQKHMHAVHLKIRNYKCKDCSRDYTNSAVLEMHRVKMHGAKPRYQCKKCNVGFTNRHEIVSHFVFECNICHKKSNKLGNHKIHMLTHTGIRPHRCEVCDKTFVQKSSLKTHSRVHTGERPYVCQYCPSSFIDSSARAKHMKFKHKPVE